MQKAFGINRSKMKILILSAPHPLKVSGLVAFDLYNALKEIEGNEVKILVKQWDSFTDKNIISYETLFDTSLRRIIEKGKRFLKFKKQSKTKGNRLDPDYHMLNYDLTKTAVSTRKLLSKVGFQPDAIIVLFMQNFLSYKNLYELNKFSGAKIYQTLMDMAPFTGGCHYAWDCMEYLNKCGSCPALYSSEPIDQTRINWEYKKKYVNQTEITVIAASDWQWNQLKKSSLFKEKDKVKILLATNSDYYFPGNKIEARKIFGLDLNNKVIFFGAVNVTERRKGYKELLNSLRFLYNDLSDNVKENIQIVIAGKVNEDIKKQILFDVKFLGTLNHQQLTIMYRAADIFLNPSIEDSGPTMINQAIMSGTPVVAFKMGVAPDLVLNGITGYMAKLGDTKDFVSGIKNILNLNASEYLKMSENCRSHALSTCSLTKIGNDYNILLNNFQKVYSSSIHT
jgi:glycosyltransferase involved in cell wall biosynthesis